MSISVDLLPTIIAGGTAFLIGGVWYGPLFGAVWTRAAGVEADQIKPVAYVVGFLSYMLIAAALSALANAVGVVSALDGMILAVVVWGGVALALGLNTTFFTARSRIALGIESGYQLVAFLVVGAILGGWGGA